ncbi:MAG TPA: hypothetical protein VIH61_07480, partial [Waddliaceae bacterium]
MGNGGSKENCPSETLTVKPQETDEVSTDEGPSRESLGKNKLPKTTAPKTVSLEAILHEIQADAKKWPQEAFKAVLQRFERMPRRGWTLAHGIFCGKFQVSISILDFKKKAREAIISKNGNLCSIKEYRKNPGKRQSAEDVVEDQQSLEEARTYQEMKTKFLVKIEELSSFKIGEVERTKKIPSTKVDGTILKALNRVAGEYANSHQPKNMTDFARILQAVQLCYQDASARPKKPSEWRTNIEIKIQKMSASIALLQRKSAVTRLAEVEIKAARKAMRDLDLILDKPKDVIKAISLLQESVQVYQKKIQMHESRREFRRDNQFFELNRRMFYRQLTEGDKITHQVSSESIKEFWSSMWNENEANDSRVSEYLVEYLPGEADLVTFPTEEEFQNIIKYLPNWKAAGIDGIYNFFIKKISSLHSVLYEVIKTICLSSQEEDTWFYKGLTYLIPK